MVSIIHSSTLYWLHDTGEIRSEAQTNFPLRIFPRKRLFEFELCEQLDIIVKLIIHSPPWEFKCQPFPERLQWTQPEKVFLQ